MDPGASVFDLTLAIAEGRRGRALSILARNLEAGEAPLRILGSLAWQYRRLWKLKESLANGGREGEVARSLRMDPWKVRAFLDRFSSRTFKLRCVCSWTLMGGSKGGSGSRPRIVLERLLLKLCEDTCRPSEQNRLLVLRPHRSECPARVVSNVRTIKSRNRTGH